MDGNAVIRQGGKQRKGLNVAATTIIAVVEPAPLTPFHGLFPSQGQLLNGLLEGGTQLVIETRHGSFDQYVRAFGTVVRVRGIIAFGR
jgi:hypothetical protein